MSKSASSDPAEKADRRADFCEFCGAELERASASGVSTHLCPECRAPQPLRSDESYFTLLGVPRKFAQDPALLQRKFYELSRMLHPDRFSAAKNPAWQALSLQRMSEINQAYQALRKPEAILEYLLGGDAETSSGREAPRAKIPMDLAEEWFEVQDLVMEDPASALQRLEDLKQTLQERAQHFSEKMKEAEDRFDQSQGTGEENEALESMRRIRQESAYISSMRRDIDRLEAKLAVPRDRS